MHTFGAAIIPKGKFRVVFKVDSKGLVSVLYSVSANVTGVDPFHSHLALLSSNQSLDRLAALSVSYSVVASLPSTAGTPLSTRRGFSARPVVRIVFP